MIGWGLFIVVDYLVLGLVMLFGIGFGLFIECVQICFIFVFCDMWIIGWMVMVKVIIFGMVVSVIGIFSYV